MDRYNRQGSEGSVNEREKKSLCHSASAPPPPPMALRACTIVLTCNSLRVSGQRGVLTVQDAV